MTCSKGPPEDSAGTTGVPAQPAELYDATHYKKYLNSNLTKKKQQNMNFKTTLGSEKPVYC